MNYTEFMNAMLCEIRGQVDAQVRTELYTVTKNNGTRRTGILFKQEDSNLAPTIYLEEFYQKYHDKGLEILDIPCNQFAGQTPGTDEEIHEFCTLKYHTEFPQMKKSDVNGEHQLPLYAYLKSKKGFAGFGKVAKAAALGIMLRKIDKNYKENPDIKWNFTKFLVDRQGTVVVRFEPTGDMRELEEQILTLL